jgi:hypothetical protein
MAGLEAQLVLPADTIQALGGLAREMKKGKNFPEP